MGGKKSITKSAYSMMYRKPGEKLLPVFYEFGIGFVPFSLSEKGFFRGERAIN